MDAADWRAVELRFARVGGGDSILVALQDGRVLGLPLWLYPTLAAAAPAQRKSYELIAGGRGVHWAALGLDLSVRGMVLGTPEMTVDASRTAKRLKLRDFARAMAPGVRRAG